MKTECLTHLRFVAAALLTIPLLASVSWANERLVVPGDIQPDFYTASGGPFLLPDGTTVALNDGEWAAIPFWRPIQCVPLDFNLLETFDPRALSCPLFIAGFLEFKDGVPISWELQGVAPLPIWFVKWSELQAATADGELTIVELASLDSLQTGTATYYQDQNHLFGLHPVSHLTLVARGKLKDGRSFDLRVIEVNLKFTQAQIVFK
ncbi:MAG: hypothetical protein L0Y58_14080 [Verrucomicrobia subdivision 3 bacterium]|nr:hypothetical protein [Limisphaerales bacterium]